MRGLISGKTANDVSPTKPLEVLSTADSLTRRLSFGATSNPSVICLSSREAGQLAQGENYQIKAACQQRNIKPRCWAPNKHDTTRARMERAC